MHSDKLQLVREQMVELGYRLRGVSWGTGAVGLSTQALRDALAAALQAQLDGKWEELYPCGDDEMLTKLEWTDRFRAQLIVRGADPSFARGWAESCAEDLPDRDWEGMTPEEAADEELSCSGE